MIAAEDIEVALEVPRFAIGLRVFG